MLSRKRNWLALAVLTGTAVGMQLTPAAAQPQILHNITYIARVDGVAPGAQAAFVVDHDEVSTASLGSVPGTPFEANTVLSDPAKAGMQVSIDWPYSANMHCEIDVDGNAVTQIDRFVRPALNTNDPMNGVLACGAPLPT